MEERKYNHFKCPKCGLRGMIGEKTKDGYRIAFKNCPVCGEPLEAGTPTLKGDKGEIKPFS